MNILIPFLFLAVFGYVAWDIHVYSRESINYREARKAEIKRRLQVEAKADNYWKERISTTDDIKQRLLFEAQATRERHERAIKYVLADIFERYN